MICIQVIGLLMGILWVGLSRTGVSMFDPSSLYRPSEDLRS
jgi:hypothetical protein